ncbi:hypothetical protein O7626_40405 [Micromonospora sp. WMMD1102]|uniref:hypothetical protein n=1 Tax=Micromonospora sp. WMMD1102 TaxID=3016105 RepID=UPI0024156948|nr:hypothetical protein [Micromonospora sp. WMMD1102]MDG4792081.1 hypothetical protein [Micromonospora sp. WMMD1102]
MTMTYLPTVGDLVFATDHRGVENPGEVTAVRDVDGHPWIDVFTAGTIGRITVGPDDVRPIDVPRPAVGQRWRCLTRPDLLVEVVFVEHGGLFTSCRMPSGRVAPVILLGYFEPVGEV